MHKSWLILFICIALLTVRAVDSGTNEEPFLSPDNQWEYRYSEVIGAGIVKAGTNQIVLDLSDDVPRPEDAKVVWAPDSKRFAFNHSPPHASHTSYETTTLYQLRGDRWVSLDSLVEQSSDRAQLAQLAREDAPKNARLRRIWASQPTRDILRVREWPDANTAIFYAYAAWDRNGRDQGEAAFLFTVKFDADGKLKLTRTHEMSKKEMTADEKSSRG